MSLTSGSQTITTTATPIGTLSGSRSALVVQNPAGGSTIYIGGATVTSSNGIAVAAGDPPFTATDGDRDSLGAERWYAVTASGTAVIRTVET